ncbi:MAG TPA: lamin tail domain-containing protein, partial [Flavobacteriales bacterium]
YYRVRAIGGSSTSANSNVIQVITGENDCLGVFNGPALPGTACDDSDALTINDVYGSDCICIGEPIPPVDCNGVENGPALPGTACDDNNVFTSNDTWTSECACVGTFVPTPPSVTTAAATSITATSGVLNGSLVSEGSSTVSAYGFEWSTSAGFTPGTGTVLASSDLNSGSFSATLSALAPGSAVYYVAFATNTEGTSYGPQMQLNTVALGVPVAIAATDVDATSFTANWSPVDFATGYLLDVSTSPTFSGAVPASDLIISEYVEGSSNNKYLELFNGTGATVDLSDYQLLLFANGASSASNTVALTGNLADGATIVYKNSSAAIYGGAATNSAATNFNGDDAVALRRISTNSYVDIFGSIGNDPGTAWTATGLSTVDRTLVRRSSVSSGLSANPAATFPSLASEWDGFAQDDVSHLGQHTYNGQGPSFLPGYESLAVSGTSQVVSGLQPGQTYYYRVRAVIDALVSANSNTIDVTTVDPSGCTDPLAQNHDAGATEDDGSCTYCPATITYNTAIPTPIQIGTGLPASNAAVSVDCHPITIGLSAFERFVGPIVPVNDNVYRVALGNSPTSSSDP